jgi:hypothetical protein
MGYVKGKSPTTAQKMNFQNLRWMVFDAIGEIFLKLHGLNKYSRSKMVYFWVIWS